MTCSPSPWATARIDRPRGARYGLAARQRACGAAALAAAHSGAHPKLRLAAAHLRDGTHVQAAEGAAKAAAAAAAAAAAHAAEQEQLCVHFDVLGAGFEARAAAAGALLGQLQGSEACFRMPPQAPQRNMDEKEDVDEEEDVAGCTGVAPRQVGSSTRAVTGCGPSLLDDDVGTASCAPQGNAP